MEILNEEVKMPQQNLKTFIMKRPLHEKLLSSERNCLFYNRYTNTNKVKIFHGLNDKVIKLIRRH